MSSSLVVSPKQMINIIDKIEKALWVEYPSYQNVERYLSRWEYLEYDYDYYGSDRIVSVCIEYKPDKKIDVKRTLDKLPYDLLFKIAVDLNVEIPELIYSVAEIKGILASQYENASDTFLRAYQKIYSDPDVAISMANSALEQIIKKICDDNRLKSCNSKDTSKKLIEHILKEFNFHPSEKTLQDNIRNLGSQIISIVNSIENIRSQHTTAHGVDFKVNDPIYASLVINSVSTVGLFLLNYYEKHYKNQKIELNTNRYCEIDDDIPF
jgi:hypothetical protein